MYCTCTLVAAEMPTALWQQKQNQVLMYAIYSVYPPFAYLGIPDNDSVRQAFTASRLSDLLHSLSHYSCSTLLKLTAVFQCRAECVWHLRMSTTHVHAKSVCFQIVICTLTAAGQSRLRVQVEDMATRLTRAEQRQAHIADQYQQVLQQAQPTTLWQHKQDQVFVYPIYPVHPLIALRII